MIAQARHSRISGADPWRTLEALSLYRLVASVALIVLASSAYRPPYFEGERAGFIDATLFVYLLIAACLIVLVRGQRPPALWQGVLQISTDIGFIILLDYKTGGIASGLGALLVTPITAGSLLFDRRLNTVPPAVATIALLLVEIYLNLQIPDYQEQYTQTGILGAGLFIIAVSGSILTRRARDSEARAHQAQSDVAKLSALSESVIQKLQAGVLVCDARGQIELCNRAARRLMGAGTAPGRHLSACAPAIWHRLSHWLQDPAVAMNAAVKLNEGQRAWVQFTRLGHGDSASTLIVLDDASRVEEQAQHLKLASLGRLTASIAHELRNPLSAIQHAAELASESPELASDDRNLVDIIRRQTTRLDDIIRSVLSLSRRHAGVPQAQALRELIDHAVHDFRHAQQPPPEVHVSVSPETLQVMIEPVQFQQILHNLLHNATVHARREGQPLKIEISARPSPDGDEVLIDLRDNGPGIPKDIAAQVFEPFFSTSHQGTGLGLFITRELCNAAHGELQLISGHATPGAYFRLNFPASLTPS